MELFISYAREDVAKVRQIVEILVAGGHVAWFDIHLMPGQDWKRELGQAVARCDTFVYATTAEAMASEWCDWELATAVYLEKAIIPVLLEPHVAIPEPLQRLQYADFSLGATPIAVAKLMGALSLIQKIPIAEAPPLPAEPKGIPAAAWKEHKHWTNTYIKPVHQPQDEQEQIVEKFGANLMRGVEGVGGRMILTNQRVLFEAHKLNIQRAPLEIPLAEIESVTTTSFYGFIPTGIIVRCRSGQEHRFVVWKRREVIAKIEAVRRRRQPPG